MNSSAMIVAGLTCLVVAIAGCNRDRDAARTDDRTGLTTTTGASALAGDVAVTRIAEARCSREAACNNIGSDKTYADRNACMQKLRTDLRDDLGSSECARGIDQKELDECLQEIRNASCDNPLDHLERLAACRSSDLCHSVGVRP